MAIPPSASDVWPPRSIMAGRQASRAMEDDNALLTRSPLRLLGRVLLPLSDYKIALSFPLHFPFPAPTTITCRPFCLAAASPRHSIRRRVRSSELWCSTSQTTDSKRQMRQTPSSRTMTTWWAPSKQKRQSNLANLPRWLSLWLFCLLRSGRWSVRNKLFVSAIGRRRHESHAVCISA